MRLYFLRHVEAMDEADDAARRLTRRGEKEAREVGRFVKRAGIEFDAVYSSPLVRAKQTAEIVSEICGTGELEIADALLNETSQAQFDGWLKGLPEAKHVLLVGHAPTLADRVRQLLGIAAPEAFKLPKGGLACLETENRRTAALKFAVTPKLLGVQAD
ncbi:MAG: phosphohistidine phosphatase SixA [Verrucomicrobia bacterium]|nr:MAG: phosphohistidine phosphatase SixA [Verrucomicrobiota bacterium]